MKPFVEYSDILKEETDAKLKKQIKKHEAAAMAKRIARSRSRYKKFGWAMDGKPKPKEKIKPKEKSTNVSTRVPPSKKPIKI